MKLKHNTNFLGNLNKKIYNIKNIIWLLQRWQFPHNTYFIYLLLDDTILTTSCSHWLINSLWNKDSAVSGKLAIREGVPNLKCSNPKIQGRYSSSMWKFKWNFASCHRSIRGRNPGRWYIGSTESKIGKILSGILYAKVPIIWRNSSFSSCTTHTIDDPRNKYVVFWASWSWGTSCCCRCASNRIHCERCWYVFIAAVALLLSDTVLIVCGRHLKWPSIIITLDGPGLAIMVLETILLAAHIAFRATELRDLNIIHH